MKETVAAVIVTYNRKELLIECLDAVCNQTYRPDAIYIIDNNSNDGTPELLLEKKYIQKLPECKEEINQIIKGRVTSLLNPLEVIDIIYVRKKENDGGAGGFHEGINLAYKDNFDWLWIMDDDGIPEKNCLNILLGYSRKKIIDYVAPNLIDELGKSHFSNFFEVTSLDTINYYGGPFNGILISNYLVSIVGLPIKSFFIWGDEMEYRNRIMEKGFITLTVKNAIHRHKRTTINYKKVPRVYFFTRNLIYCSRLFNGVYRSNFVYKLGVYITILKILAYGICFINFNQVKNCLKGIRDGLKGNIRNEQIESIVKQ